MLRFGFDDFLELYTNFKQSFKQSNSEDFLAFEEQTARVENFLKIDIEDDFLSWMDDDMGIYYLPNGGGSEQLGIAIKTKDIEQAQERMDFVLSQIKRRLRASSKQSTTKNTKFTSWTLKDSFLYS